MQPINGMELLDFDVAKIFRQKWVIVHFGSQRFKCDKEYFKLTIVFPALEESLVVVRVSWTEFGLSWT